MTNVFVDTSVLVAWFHAGHEHDVGGACAVLAAHEQGITSPATG